MGIKCVEPKYEVSIQHIDFKKDTVKSRSVYCETSEDAHYIFGAIYDSTLPLLMADHANRYACATDFRCHWLCDDDDLFIIKLQKIVSD